MKFILKTLFFGAFLVGGAYLVFRTTPIGKAKLTSYLLTRWEGMADFRDVTIDREYIYTELQKLEYPDLELLVRITLLDPLQKEQELVDDSRLRRRFDRILFLMKQRRVVERADLSQLENFILPG